MPFWSTIFPAALAAYSSEYLVLPEPLPPKQPHHLHIWPSLGRPKPSRAASEQTPLDDPQAEVEIKPQLKPRGSVAKEEDPKPSHKMQIKYTGSTRQTVFSFRLSFFTHLFCSSQFYWHCET